jgi:uncharacterized membrane protein YdfJ with MMPL/SSD domain
LVPLYWTAPVSAFVIWWPWVRTSHILLVPRLRQEVAAHGAVEGVARAVGRTGGVIISCRLVMACVFLIGLARNPIYPVQKIGVAVVVGVVLDIFLVRPVLVPAWHSSSGALVAGLRPDSAAPSSRTDRPARARAVRAIGEGRGEPDLTARRGPDALESLASAWWLETVGVSAKTVGSHH